MPLKISKKSSQTTLKSSKSASSARVVRHRKMVVGVLIGGCLLIAGLAAVIFSAAQNQDLRQQASTHAPYACSGYGSYSVGCRAGEVCVGGTCLKNAAYLTPTPTAFPAGYCDPDTGVWNCQPGEYCYGNKCEQRSSVECAPDDLSQCNAEGNIDECRRYMNKTGQTVRAIKPVYCQFGCVEPAGQDAYCKPEAGDECTRGSEDCNGDGSNGRICVLKGNKYVWQKKSWCQQMGGGADALCITSVINGVKKVRCEGEKG